MYLLHVITLAMLFVFGNVYAGDSELKKHEEDVGTFVTGKIVKVEDNGNLVQLKRGVWMIRNLVHLKVLSGNETLVEKTIVVARYRNVKQTDRDLFDDDRDYLLSMVDQPIQASLKKDDIIKAILSVSEDANIWQPAGGFIDDHKSFADVQF